MLTAETARREYRHRVESQTYDEQYNGTTPATRGEDLALNFRLSERVRVIGRAQVQTKFGRREDRRRWRRRVALDAVGNLHRTRPGRRKQPRPAAA